MIRRAAALTLAPLAGCLLQVAAAPPTNAGHGVIYTCTAADGRRLTSDRPIPECLGREQRLLNRDGSLRRVEPPPMTAKELAAHEAQERQRAAELAAHQEAVRRDRNLALRYPDEASHARARTKALQALHDATQASEKRLAALAEERRKLMAEADFYQGKPLPLKLRQQLEGNEATAQAQRESIHNQQAEADRINRLYDGELERLRRLWAGAAPGAAATASR